MKSQRASGTMESLATERHPGEEARLIALRELIGEPSSRSDARGVLAGVRREAERNWRHHVEPLISEHWPEVRGRSAYVKFRILALELYVYAPYAVIVLSRERPWGLRAFNRWSRRLRLDKKAISRLLEIGFPWWARLFLRREGMLIMLGAAFVAVADEVLDRRLGHLAPGERGRRIWEVVLGRAEARTNDLSLLRALVEALQRAAPPGELASLERILEGSIDWADGEIARQRGAPDPEGLAHRGVGIEVVARGMAWTVARYVGEQEREWMSAVSWMVQMVDDWVDLDDDLEEGIRTPVAEGAWGLSDIHDSFRECNRSVGDIARANGESYEPYLELLEESFVEQIRLLLSRMMQGAAA